MTVDLNHPLDYWLWTLVVGFVLLAILGGMVRQYRKSWRVSWPVAIGLVALMGVLLLLRLAVR